MTRSITKLTRARRATPLALLAAPLSLLVALSPQSADARVASTMAVNAWALGLATAVAPNRVDGLAVEELDDGTTILRLRGTSKPTFNVYRLEDPKRLVVDISGSERGKVVPHVPLDTWACGRVTLDSVSERDTKLVRVVVELKREVSYIVVPDHDELVVTVTPRQMPPEAYFARKSATKRQQEIEADRAHVSQMQDDATELKARATQRVKAAELKAKQAERDADKARNAAKGARAAEARAKAAEADAQTELRDAKTNKFAARRALRAATAEREKLATERAEAEKQLAAAMSAAQNKRKDAEQVLAAAEAVAKKRLAEAASKKQEAEEELARAHDKLASANDKLVSADIEAKRRLAEADSTGAEAKRRLAAADSTSLEASRRLSAAEATNAAASKALASAKQTASEARAEAAAEVAAAKKSAATAEKDAKARLAAAEADAARARAAAEKATLEAKKLAASEAQKAERLRTSSDALAKKKLKDAEARAATKLAAAEKELTAARKAASTAQSEADARLAQAKRELDAAKTKAAVTESSAKKTLAAAELERRNAKNEAAGILAKAEAAAAARLRAADVEAAASSEKEIARARQEAKALLAQAKVDSERLTRERIEAAELEASKTVAKAESKARVDARAHLEAAELEAEQKLAAAKKAATKSTIAEAERELARVRKQGATYVATAASNARKKAQTDADAKLAKERTQIEAAAAQQVKLARAAAKKAEDAAKEKLAAADTKLKDADTKLKSADTKLRDAEVQQRSALSLRKEAAQALATAEKSKHRAEEDRKLAIASRERAESALQEARAQAAADEKSRGSVSTKAKTAIAKAEKARDSAIAREASAAKELAGLASERDGLQTKLAERDTKLAERDAQLATLQKRLEKAEASAVRSEEDARVARASAAAPPPPAPVAETEAPVLAKASPKKPSKHKEPTSRVDDVRFESDASEERIVVKFQGPVAYNGMSLTPTIQLLKFEKAELAQKLERSLDATSYNGPIKVITTFSEGADTKVIVSTVGPSRPKLEEKPGELVWHFPRSKRDAVAQTEAVSLAGTKVGGFASAPRPAAAAAPPEFDPTAQADVTRGRRSSSGRWRGERIDIELQDAPIKDVLLLFSDIGRVNIVAGNGVEGSVTMKLNSVPWDQALDIILRSLSLGSSREGNVIRVATLDALEDERKQAIERANARVQLKPMETRLVSVSYATAEEMVPKVQRVLSARGTVTPDTRTNKLIIMDVSENIALAEELIRSLDTQTPQVLIEARIVEARTNFTRQLGIQWGFDFTASPGTGNPTGLLFPNSVGVGGGGTGQPADTRGLILPGAAANPNYAVDLPAPVGTGAGGAVGFSFGSISGNLNTNLRLSAAEGTGEVRIISAPKIVTLDNSQAQIEQGVQIPISQVSAQGVNTRFVNAALSLQVTPHVTNEGAVLLDVTVQKNEADFVNTGARGDPTILTKQAQSRMLVNDNDTAVIGGIYTRNKAVNYTKIPWLGDIPIIGWFFKSKNEADTRSEVLIFLTPKIVNRAGSIGG